MGVLVLRSCSTTAKEQGQQKSGEQCREEVTAPSLQSCGLVSESRKLDLLVSTCPHPSAVKRKHSAASVHM